MARPRKSAAKKAPKKEVSAAIKSFKATEEVVEFYTYVHESGLRVEAGAILKAALETMKPVKKRKKRVLH